MEKYTHAQIAQYLRDGFWEWQGDLNEPEFDHTDLTVNLTGISAEAKTLARTALEQYAAATGLSFTETSGGADITFREPGDATAYSRFTRLTEDSDGTHTIEKAVIEIGTGWLDTYGRSVESYSYQTFVHEIGHALGLGHAGAYNGSADWETDAHYANDSWQATVMSYFSQYENEAVDASFAYVLSPQTADLVALQDMYGRGGGRAGDTTYGYNASPDAGIYDADRYSGNISYTIWDAGGIDTLDYSRSHTDDRIDLRPTLENSTEVRASDVWGEVGNVAIAPGTLIEHAVAGNGDNRIFGNRAANQLDGAGGDDVVTGGAGNDRAVGGTGDDRLFGQRGNDALIGGHGKDVLAGGTGDDRLYGDDGHDRLYGGGGNDRLYAGVGNDFAVGRNGSDILSGSDGNDRLYGDAGNDTVGGGTGDDRVYGGAGADRLGGGAGDDVLRGGAGNDLLAGSWDSDRLLGDGGADRLAGQSGTDVLGGGAGDDVLYGGAHSDSLYGGSGDDRLVGGDGQDLLVGHGGDDLLLGDAGNDTLRGQTGNDVQGGGRGDDLIYGDAGADRLGGGAGDDVLRGGAGNDLVRGSWGADRLHGDGGDDRLAGQAGVDVLGGGAGNDVLYGGDDDDRLYGHAHSDELHGGDGDDTLFGGGGADRLGGGLGADSFVFHADADSDVVTDFELREDTLVLDDNLWNGSLSREQVVDRFARLEGDDAVFDFGGGDTVTLRDVGTLELEEDLLIV